MRELTPSEVTLVLTTDCNLRCRYCYQDAKGPRAMSWPVLQAALEAVSGPPPRPIAVSFTGGEPTLNWESIERAVAFVNRQPGASHGPGRPALYRLTTNGLLLGGAELAFLAVHDFLVTLSMDGVARAQDVRGAGTFDRLDALLQRWCGQDGDHLRRRCRVAITVTRPAISHLARSVEHLLARDVPNISLRPAMGENGWTDGDLEQLDDQLAGVQAAAEKHHRRTGRVPVTAFRAGIRLSRRSRTWACGAPVGRAITVDVDGQVYPCVLAAQSYQRIAHSNSGLGQRLACLKLGDIREGLDALAAPWSAAAASGLFGPQRLQHAGERRCASCRLRADCHVCPIGRRWGEPAGDPGEVPAYLCGFNRLVQKHARRFRAAAGLESAGTDRVLRWLFAKTPGRLVTT